MLQTLRLKSENRKMSDSRFELKVIGHADVKVALSFDLTEENWPPLTLIRI